MCSPVASLGRYFCFCSGVPKRMMPFKPIDWWAPSMTPSEASMPPISCMVRAKQVVDRPTLPYSAGMFRPKSPRSFRPRMTSSGMA